MTITQSRLSAFTRDYGVYAALVLLALLNVLVTRGFLTVETLREQVILLVPVLIVALGMALVIGTGGVDLSVGAVMALSAAVLPLSLDYGVVPALVACVLTGVVTGMLSGSLVAFLNVQPIVATLAVLVVGRGIALVIAGGETASTGLGVDVPTLVVIAVALAVAVSVLAGRTTFGRQLVAIGGNRTAARYSGLPVNRVLLTSYVLCGSFAAVAGMFSRLTASDPSRTGELIGLSAITAVVAGGTPLSGGRIRVLGTVAGVVLIQLVTATLLKNGAPASVAQMVQAVIIIAAVVVQRGTR